MISAMPKTNRNGDPIGRLRKEIDAKTKRSPSLTHTDLEMVGKVERLKTRLVEQAERIRALEAENEELCRLEASLRSVAPFADSTTGADEIIDEIKYCFRVLEQFGEVFDTEGCPMMVERGIETVEEQITELEAENERLKKGICDFADAVGRYPRNTPGRGDAVDEVIGLVDGASEICEQAYQKHMEEHE